MSSKRIRNRVTAAELFPNRFFSIQKGPWRESLKNLIKALLFAFCAMQLATFLCLAPGQADGLLGARAVPEAALIWQILAFGLALVLLGQWKKRQPALDIWPWTALLAAMLSLFICLWGKRFTLVLGMCVLLAILLFTLREEVESLGSLWRRSWQARRQYRPGLAKLSLSLPQGIALAVLAMELCQLMLLFILSLQPLSTEGIKTGMNPLFRTDVLLAFLGLTLAVFLLAGLVISAWPAPAESGTDSLSRRQEWICGLILLALALALHLYGFNRILIARVRTFSTPAFDFGLFAQMFAYMRRTGLPLTTLERDGLHSHFLIHFSPIYYLLLPFYTLFPEPETLQVLQTLVVLSGAVPACLLGRNFRLRPLLRMVFTALYMLLPVLMSSGSYDLHENCFLAPLILWYFLGILSGRSWLRWLAAVFLLLVKEDAPLYVISGALFLFFSPYCRQDKKAQRDALGMTALSLFAFLLITRFLDTSGFGVMSDRFAALDPYEKGGLLGIVQGLFQNPAHLFSILFAEAKRAYLLALLFSFGPFLFWQAHRSSYLLFLPLLVMNLATVYPYQYQINFQYNYGSQAFLWVALLLATVSSLQTEPRPEEKTEPGTDRGSSRVWRQLALSSLVVALCCSTLFSSLLISQQWWLVDAEKKDARRFSAMRQTLAALPRDAVIAANPFLTTALSDVQELYSNNFNESIQAGRPVDFYVFQRGHLDREEEKIAERARKWGFQEDLRYSSPEIQVLSKAGFAQTLD